MENSGGSVGGASSGNDSERTVIKRLKFLGQGDRISALPDSLIQHIISFLPSTKEAIQTGILSKRWLNQWTRVPVLIFESPGMSSDRFDLKFARFVDNALHLYDCLKIRKFHIAYKFEKDPNFISKIRFAIRKNVEELILHRCQDGDAHSSYKLPKFILENDSLVKLQIIRCDFQPIWRINWPSLKVLKIQGRLSCGQSIENVLSGSPSLESLEIKDFIKRSFFTFSSTSLKILILADIEITCNFDISCPNLEELYVKRIDMEELISFPDKAIKDFVSGSPLLHTLEVIDCLFEELVIASKSLKKLVIGGLDEGSIEISCPNIEELTLYGLANEPFKVTNFPSLIRATLDFDMAPLICGEHVAKMMLDQLQNVKELSMGTCSFTKVLSDVGMKGLSYPWSNNKILTLDRPDFEHLPGIMCALRSSSTLERLVIKLLEVHEDEMTSLAFEENYWNSNGTAVNCLVSHLKTVEIIGLCKRDPKCELVLNFIKFLLKNTRVLEKLVLVISEKDGGTSFAFEVSQKVSSFPRCSPHAVVELSCSE